MTTADTLDVLKTILGFIILPFVGYVIARLKELEKADQLLNEKISNLDRHILEIKIALIGIDGQNGIRSEVNKLRERASNHDI
jgi:hypothetical protein